MTTRGNLSAQQIAAISPTRKEVTIQATADNSPIRIVYGETTIAGDVFAYGLVSGDLVVGVAWCYGEIESVERCYINDEELPISGVTVTHYLGTTWQTADSDLQAAIATFDDDMVLSTPDGSVGIAYSVFRIDPSAIATAPRFHAVIKGAKVDDPRPSEDPAGAFTRLWWDAAVSNTDQSVAPRTLTAANSVTIENGAATNSAVGEGITVSGGFGFSTVNFCVESKFTVNPTETGIVDIFRATTTPAAGLILRVNDDAIQVVVYDGTTLVISGDKYTLPDATQELDVALFRISGTFYLYVNGVQQWTQTIAADITQSTSNRFCYSESGPRVITQRSLRVTIGSAQYAAAQYEPRGYPFANCRRYSANSALCWGDLATHTIYGMGVAVSGLPAAADWNDALLNGLVPRCRLALALTRPQSTLSYLDLLATYAELIYYWSENGITVISDSTVDLSGVETEANCVAGTLTVEGVDDDDTPTRVYTRYTVPDLSSPYWAEALISQSLQGVDEGEVSLIESTLTMPGITRVEEATSKAQSRVERMRNRVRVSWTSTDKGIQWKKGQVIRHLMPNRGTDIYVRIQNVRMTSPGRYQVTGMRHSASFYPTEVEVPATTGSIPVGAILPLSGDTIPSGWEAYTAANGRFIVCAGNEYSEGDTGGSATHPGFIGSTTAVDSHGSNPSYSNFRALYFEQEGGSGNAILPDFPPGLVHSHTYSTGQFTLNLPRREHRLVKKTGTTATSVPKSLRIMGLSNLSVAGLTRVVSESNRLLYASSINALLGNQPQFLTFTSGSYNDYHFHRSTPTGRALDTLQVINTWYDYEAGGGEHTHAFSLEVIHNIKRVNVPLWSGLVDYPLVPGMIVLWDGGTVPPGWILCDGSGNTPDLRDHFIQISPEGAEFEKAGDNTIAVSGTSTPVGHDHQGATATTSGNQTTTFAHSNSITHTHDISASGSYTPKYYALSAIMFDP